MIDPIATVVEWLGTDTSVTALVGSRIYGGLLPQDVIVDQDGPAITVQVRGGSADAEVPLIRPSVQVEVWAGPYQFIQAREVYRAIFDLMHGKNGVSLTNGYILSSVEEVPGQDGVDPDTNWATVVSFWKLIMRSAQVGTFTSGLPLAAGSRHFPLESPDGVRVSFTFVGMPSDLNNFMLVKNGLIVGQGFTASGDVITLDVAPLIGDELYAYY